MDLNNTGEAMRKKQYLFYEEKTCKQKWIEASLSEKILYIMVAAICLFLLLLGVVLCAFTAAKDRAELISLMLGAVGAILLAVFLGLQSIKEYYVIFEEESAYQFRTGSIWRRKQKVPYDQVCFLIDGDVGPYIFPYRSSPETCRRSYGNYINALSADKQVLFAGRYSAELKSFLQQKCVNAQWFDIADWNVRNMPSEEVEAADKTIAEAYKGMIQ